MPLALRLNDLLGLSAYDIATVVSKLCDPPLFAMVTGDESKVACNCR
jgi:hypothetical protein